MIHTFYANGKLLLTAEYLVLDGALALALPTKFGQSLKVIQPSEEAGLHWQSIDEKGNCWFEAIFQPDTFACLHHTDKALAARLTSIFQKIKMLAPRFKTANCLLQTRLSFPRDWGLGTSSTLIHLLAQWTQVDPFALLARTFGGSGYDLACAGADGPLVYQLCNGKPLVKSVNFIPPFTDNLAFVYLGKKQNSREGISNYRTSSINLVDKRKLIEEISTLTESFLHADKLVDFEALIRKHEQIISEVVGLQRAKTLHFNDFWGEVKSLGAWGGDFVLVTSERSPAETNRYFNDKGFKVFFQYKDIVL